MRIILFLLTNLAVIAVASVTLSLLGVGSYLDQNGLNLSSLLIFCAVFGFVGSFISLFLSKTMAKMSTGTQIIKKASTPQEQWLLDTVAELADKAGIGMPDVGIFNAQQANAFATGWNKNSALVAVSTGLLQRFRPEEARAVMAHEIGHVANGDMVTLTLIQGVVNTFVMFFARIVGYFVDSLLRRGDNQGGVGFGFYIATFVAEIVFGLVASMIVAWFSRRREFRADEAGADFASKQGMIGALQRLKAEYEIPDQLPSQLNAFGINGHFKTGLAELMSSHPPLDDRIAALQAR
ncbi:protease HtpX [Neptunomonas phycophila]|jgi:heat shock protein HtpX|uniref:Protease HtpX n=1 Tax=Neptunomonas phycophila TaxID=1572645 RepID=A0AAW7XNV5_9GAMM|nr:protease HtpX [Neptunomonas phycophila]MBT3147198.1 protease HtpX [Neptunomonas phycophila]MDO6455397.1 protease HtpX [Neptunomonas phycophila]MDO6469916.1 protease HtpX [Neptunomonas phycophila]MDO6785894.1 protease HtpX [Neptunomonas phycophila]MDP2524334.1 protease HtpX [Neptunomonas phycophila]